MKSIDAGSAGVTTSAAKVTALRMKSKAKQPYAYDNEFLHRCRVVEGYY